MILAYYLINSTASQVSLFAADQDLLQCESFGVQPLYSFSEKFKGGKVSDLVKSGFCQMGESLGFLLRPKILGQTN